MTEPKQTYAALSHLFLRLLGFIYFSAFVSFGLQVKGLIGEHGILPLGNFLEFVHNTLSVEGYYRLPTIFWLNQNDWFLQAVCLVGVVFSVFLMLNHFKQLSLLILFCLYLSLYHAGQTFMSFQWDALLLEVGFLSLFMSFFMHSGLLVFVWLFRFLVFKFMLMSGIVKLFSGDISWDNLTALSYHFETQPLITPLSWHAHHLPESFLIIATAVTLFIELILPFFIFTFRHARYFVAIIFIVFQSFIMLTGNYNFFNLLTIFVCLFLFDDNFLKKIISPLVKPVNSNAVSFPLTAFGKGVLILFSGFLLCLNAAGLMTSFQIEKPQLLSQLHKLSQPFNLVNQYGPFAVMTKHRKEIILEGSDDGLNWKEYEFKYKPGDVSQNVSWIIPHQPRLDWQMWFAALGNMERNPWLGNTLVRLLENEEEVVTLLEYNPFPKAPPRYIRASLYLYEFTTRDERQSTHNVWKRTYIEPYSPALGLKN